MEQYKDFPISILSVLQNHHPFHCLQCVMKILQESNQVYMYTYYYTLIILIPCCWYVTPNYYNYSASQMRFLLHILPILLGDALNGNEFFECLLLLHDICALILSPLISEEQIPLLRLMIQQYLTNFKEQYQCNLPPKFHFLVHFPQQIIRYCYNNNNYCIGINLNKYMCIATSG